ncbi:Chromobox protein 5 [Mucor circinelloides]
MSNLEILELSDEEDQFFYEVEEIVQMVITDKGERIFEIKWKGYDSSENTFEPERNLNCPELLKEFLKKHEADGKKKN